ncbi:hypothetical protein [Sphingobium sp. CR28]|uniref:hypothetical protein n=1 Tax=Sphingobium sp. CR28 TaxID=3400272 RepID=UPI003FEEC71E
MTPRHLLALAGAGSLLAGGAWVWRIDTLRESHLSALLACRAQKAEQEETFMRAQKAAQALAAAAATKKENEHEAVRQQTDAALADLRERYRSLVLRKATADHGSAGSAGLPQNASASTGSDGTSRSARLSPETLIITQADALICADNTARLQNAQSWARVIMEKGDMAPTPRPATERQETGSLF